MTQERKRKRLFNKEELSSIKRKLSNVSPPQEPPRHQLSSNTFMFRASRAVQLTTKPKTAVTVFVEKWNPVDCDNGDHKWVPHSIPQVRQGSIFKHLRVEGPAAKHIRLLEENYDTGVFKFSIQGETPDVVEKQGQIKTFSGYHFIIKGTTIEGSKIAEIFVLTKTNHVAAGPQAIDFVSAITNADGLQDKLQVEEDEEENADDGLEPIDDEEDVVHCIPSTPSSVWPSSTVIRVLHECEEEDLMEEKCVGKEKLLEECARLLCCSVDEEISEVLLNKVENRRLEEPLLDEPQNNFDVDSLLDSSVLEEFCKPER